MPRIAFGCLALLCLAGIGSLGDAPAPAAPAKCTPPADAIRIPVGQDLQAAIDAHPAGTAFLLGAGVHREQSIVPRDGDRFYGERDAECRRLTQLRGSRALRSFERHGALHYASGQKQGAAPRGQCATGWDRCRHAEELFYDDRPLRHVASLGRVEPGSWFFDYDADRVYLADDPAGHEVEVGVTAYAFHGPAKDVRIEGLIVERYADPSQFGAIGGEGPGPRWRVVDNEVRWNHSLGIIVSDQGVIERNHVHHNGQLGVTADGADVRVEANEISHNNFAQFEHDWEAGGAKFAETTALLVRGNCVHHNDGPGLWTDIDTRGTVFEDNVVFSNQSEGIFHEVSFGATIRGNRVGLNGIRHKWLYGANILISSSAQALVKDNFVEVAAEHGNGIAVIVQDREDAHPLEWVEVRENRVTFLGDSGLVGAAADFERGERVLFDRVTFRDNVYFVRDRDQTHFEWRGRARSYAGLHGAGPAQLGKLSRDVQPVNWDCSNLQRPPARAAR